MRYITESSTHFCRLHRMVKTVFDQFVAKHYATEGINAFHQFIDPINIVCRSLCHHRLIVATCNDSYAGVIEYRDHSHITMLFVDSDFQRQGIGHELIRQMLIRSRDSLPHVITVSSSPDAVNFYQGLGFELITPEIQNEEGMIYYSLQVKTAKLLETLDPKTAQAA